jgi:hypothetical protein
MGGVCEKKKKVILCFGYKNMESTFLGDKIFRSLYYFYQLLRKQLFNYVGICKTKQN